ncbi:MAG: hypothetical protein U0183_16075 [Polyangiaceae bacterium]
MKLSAVVSLRVFVAMVAPVLAIACATGTSVPLEDEEEIVGARTEPSSTASGTKPQAPPPKPTGTPENDASTPERDASTTPDGATNPPPPPPPPPPSGGNVVNGTVSGVTIASPEAHAIVINMNGVRVTSVAVALQDRAGGCADYGLGIERPNVSRLRLQVYVNPSSNQALTPGTFTVGQGGGVFVDALLGKSGPTCGETLASPANKATSGTITFTSFQPSAVGTFDVTFPGGRMTGSFGTPQCVKNPGSSGTCAP